jgi:hypothetical protein
VRERAPTEARRVAQLEIIERTNAGTFVRFVGGECSDEMLFMPSSTGPDAGSDLAHLNRRWADLSLADQAASEATAKTLLFSFLDRFQRQDYETTGQFWVELASGSRVRLGRLHWLEYEPVDGPWERLILCVVPEGDLRATPPSDVWTSLLMFAVEDEAAFVDTANVLGRTAVRTGALARYEAVTTATLEQIVDRLDEDHDIERAAGARCALARRYWRNQRVDEARLLILTAWLGCAGDNAAALAEVMELAQRYLRVGATTTATLVELVDRATRELDGDPGDSASALARDRLLMVASKWVE